MIPAFLVKLVGEKIAGYVMVGAIVLLVAIGGMLVSRCGGHDDTAERQAEQTTASGDAFANAASGAIDTITNRVVTDQDIDAATANVQKEIDNAQDPSDIRRAVLDGVCGQSSHRNDPACKVR